MRRFFMSTAVSTAQMHNRVQEFVSRPRKMFIDGKWVEAASGKTFPTYNPATGEVLAQVAEGDREDIDRAVKAARKAFESDAWTYMSASQRGRLIWKLADLLEARTEEFAQLESLDNGKPLAVARVADVPLAVDLFRYMAGWATKIEGNTIPISAGTKKTKYFAYTRREPESVVDQVVEGVADQARKIKVGPGFEADTGMGPLVSLEQFNRVCGYLESGLSEGAEAVVGGKKKEGPGYFVEPTVMVKTNPNMKVVREEIFGPVVVASPFSDIDQIVAEANNSEYGLAAGVWTNDINKAHRVAHKLRAGTVWINCYNIFDAALPFGGYKQSGWGREMGHEVLEMYTEVKAICAAI